MDILTAIKEKMMMYYKKEKATISKKLKES